MNSRNTWLARQVPLCLIQLSTGHNALKVAVLSRVWHWTTCPPLVSLGLFIFVNVSDHIYSNIYRCRAHILLWAPDSVAPAPVFRTRALVQQPSSPHGLKCQVCCQRLTFCRFCMPKPHTPAS